MKAIRMDGWIGWGLDTLDSRKIIRSGSEYDIAAALLGHERRRASLDNIYKFPPIFCTYLNHDTETSKT